MTMPSMPQKTGRNITPAPSVHRDKYGRLPNATEEPKHTNSSADRHMQKRWEHRNLESAHRRASIEAHDDMVKHATAGDRKRAAQAYKAREAHLKLATHHDQLANVHHDLAVQHGAADTGRHTQGNANSDAVAAAHKRVGYNRSA